MNDARKTKKELVHELAALRQRVAELGAADTKEIPRLPGEAVLGAINKVFRERISCHTEEELAATCLAVAEELTGSRFGLIDELNAAGRVDAIAISNPGWDACKMPRSEATILLTDLEVGSYWGRVLKEGESQIVNDPASDPDSIGTPVGHPPITCFLGVPLRHGEKTTGLIGLANKEGGYTLADQEAVESLSVAIVEALRSKRAEDRLAQQAQEILELSTPVMQVWEGVVLAPLIGVLDSQRTQRFMEVLLERIVETNSPVALVDITGVPTIDTKTAQHLIETISAARLLGAQVILTGVRPAIAQTLVHLGIDLADIDTRASLAAGLRRALEIRSLEVTGKNTASPTPRGMGHPEIEG